MTAHSGDTVRIHTVSTCSLEKMEAGGVPHSAIPQYDWDIHEQVKDKGPGGHILTGPLAIAEAEPGDVLEVQILKIEIDVPYACNGFSAGRGFLPNDYPYSVTKVIPLDREHMLGDFAPGVKLPLHPFFGSMGVAPPTNGRLNSGPPWMHAGNMDNKELVAGTTLYLPIFVDEALFSVGDGHGAQGDGEVCVNAIETGLIGRFRLTVRDDMALAWPMAETPTHVITMAFDPDLDDCVVVALRSMLDLIELRTTLKRHEAYMLCSLAADLRITQVVNDHKGVHVMLEKHYLQPAR